MDMFSNVNALNLGLNASQLRAEVINNNIANNDTPDFNRSSVEFESYFKSALDGDDFSYKRTREKHMDLGMGGTASPRIVEDTSTTMRMDGNNVDIDKEMTDLAKNVIYYHSLTTQVTKEFELLKIAIDGR